MHDGISHFLIKLHLVSFVFCLIEYIKDIAVTEMPVKLLKSEGDHSTPSSTIFKKVLNFISTLVFLMA
jgi:hypothetical protein